MNVIPEFTALLAAYVLGATPFGYMAGKMQGIDIREHGSGNIGATNVLRTLGKPIGITVLILDLLKGLAPVLAAKLLSPEDALVHILAGIGTILGHNFTFWLRFRGGKGIATSAGVLVGLTWIAALAGVAVWLVLFFTTKYVAVASIGAAVAIPVVVLLGESSNIPLVIFSVLVAVLAIVRHRSNIQRLLAGTENRFGSSPKHEEVPK